MNEFVLIYLNGPTLACGALGAMYIQVRDTVSHVGQDGVNVTVTLSGFPEDSTGMSLTGAPPTAGGGITVALLVLGTLPGNYGVTISSTGIVSQTFTFIGTSSVIPATIWDAVKSNFQTVIEGTIPGITTNKFHAVAGLHGLAKVPGSNFDRAYHVHPRSLDQYIPSVGNIFDFVYTIKVEFGYEWNFNAGDTLLDAAIDEFEYFIKQRLNPATWAGTSIVLITFSGSKDIPPIEMNEESLTFGFFEVDFKVRGRITY